MKVLGISAYFHDSSAALVVNGELVCAAAEERFTLHKHDSNFPEFAIDHCLQMAGITSQDLDLVVFYEEPHKKFLRVLAALFSDFPRGVKFFARGMKYWLSSKLWIENKILSTLDVHPDKIVLAPHHLAHAVHSFVSSGFDNACVLIIDGVGEWESTSIFRASWKNGRPQLDVLETIGYPHSLGLFYSAWTAFLGLRANDEECSLMALAAFGTPRYVAQVQRTLEGSESGLYHLNIDYFSLHEDGLPLSKKFFEAFGPQRDPRQAWPFDCLKSSEENNLAANSDDQRWADLAASVQAVLEQAMLGLGQRATKLCGSRNLCLGGGVALNCVANAALLSSGSFDDLAIPFDPGDGGGAIGAAYFGYYTTSNAVTAPVPPPLCSPYLGESHQSNNIEDLLPYLNPAHWRRFQLAGQRVPTSIHGRNFDHFEELIDAVVEQLLNGRIIGWHQDRFEMGARALGNRSILAHPGSLSVAKRLSLSVKKRATFRPYALSITIEDAPRLLEFPGNVNSSCLRWMQCSVPVRADWVQRVRAGLHVDGTTRAQICRAEDNPKFHALLTAFGKRFGVSALLNTSFNMSGLPIHNRPVEALLHFASSDLDILVVNNLLLTKEYENVSTQSSA